MGGPDPGDLVSRLYEELRRLAHHYMRGERSDHVLQTTALVNEAYLRLAQVDRMEFRDRAHFLAMAATQMRRILVDHARGRDAGKRGGGLQMTSLGDFAVSLGPLRPTQTSRVPSGDHAKLVTPCARLVTRLGSPPVSGSSHT